MTMLCEEASLILLGRQVDTVLEPDYKPFYSTFGTALLLYFRATEESSKSQFVKFFFTLTFCKVEQMVLHQVL